MAAHLAEDADDSGGWVQAQVLAHVAVDADLAPQQQRGRVQRAGRGDNVLRLEHYAPLAASQGGRCCARCDACRAFPPQLVSSLGLGHQDLLRKYSCTH